jgi:hypothetical protein
MAHLTAYSTPQASLCRCSRQRMPLHGSATTPATPAAFDTSARCCLAARQRRCTAGCMAAAVNTSSCNLHNMSGLVQQTLLCCTCPAMFSGCCSSHLNLLAYTPRFCMAPTHTNICCHAKHTASLRTPPVWCAYHTYKRMYARAPPLQRRCDEAMSAQPFALVSLITSPLCSCQPACNQPASQPARLAATPAQPAHCTAPHQPDN